MTAPTCSERFFFFVCVCVSHSRRNNLAPSLNFQYPEPLLKLFMFPCAFTSLWSECEADSMLVVVVFVSDIRLAVKGVGLDHV